MISEELGDKEVAVSDSRVLPRRKPRATQLWRAIFPIHLTSPGHTTLASAHGSPTACASTPSTLTGILIWTSPAPKGLVELVFMIDLFYWARINFRGSNSQEEMPFYLGGRRLLRFFLYDDCFTD